MQQKLEFSYKEPDIVVTSESPVQQQTTLTGKVLSATSLKVKYITLPGNQPNANGNWVAIWQSSEFPFNNLDSYISKQQIPTGSQSGDFTFSTLQLGSLPYLVGYGTGADLTTVCATTQFTPGQSPTNFVISLSLVDVDNNSLTIGYNTPVGNAPLKYGDWVGLWEGQSPTWDGSLMLAKATPTSNNNSDVVVFNDLNLKFSTYYTVAYATGQANTTLTTILTFQTSPYLAAHSQQHSSSY